MRLFGVCSGLPLYVVYMLVTVLVVRFTRWMCLLMYFLGVVGLGNVNLFMSILVKRVLLLQIYILLLGFMVVPFGSLGMVVIVFLCLLGWTRVSFGLNIFIRIIVLLGMVIGFFGNFRPLVISISFVMCFFCESSIVGLDCGFGC